MRAHILMTKVLKGSDGSTAERSNCDVAVMISVMSAATRETSVAVNRMDIVSRAATRKRLKC